MDTRQNRPHRPLQLFADLVGGLDLGLTLAGQTIGMLFWLLSWRFFPFWTAKTKTINYSRFPDFVIYYGEFFWYSRL